MTLFLTLKRIFEILGEKTEKTSTNSCRPQIYAKTIPETMAEYHHFFQRMILIFILPSHLTPIFLALLLHHHRYSSYASSHFADIEEYFILLFTMDENPL